MNIKPLGDNLLVRMIDREPVTRGGIVLADNAKEKPQEAEVLAVGTGRYIDGVKVLPEVAVGDTVLLNKYAGAEVKIKGEKFMIVREIEVLAIIEGE